MRRQLAAGEDEGYFGPDSVLWSVNREAVLGLGLGRAVLMQIAHPWVAQAVSDHSSVGTHPVQRLLGTVEAAEFLTFGSTSQADRVAHQLNTMHAHINGHLKESVGRWRVGDEYRADDPDALLWVLATLIDTTFVMHDVAFPRMPRSRENAYISDVVRLGAMLGVRAEDVPGNRTSLREYLLKQVDDGTVAVGDTGRALGRDLINRNISLGPLFRPYQSLSGIVAVGLLPESIRRLYGFTLSARERLIFHTGHFLGCRVPRRLPQRIRTDPIAWEAIKRAS
ncbi:MAG: oxygenase MpaB family protein [Chloroflexota bacterium]